jgi:hypothetical protein
VFPAVKTFGEVTVIVFMVIFVSGLVEVTNSEPEEAARKIKEPPLAVQFIIVLAAHVPDVTVKVMFVA